MVLIKKFVRSSKYTKALNLTSMNIEVIRFKQREILAWWNVLVDRDKKCTLTIGGFGE